MRLLIANGYVVDPTQGVNGGRGILIEDGRVVSLLQSGGQAAEGAGVFDATRGGTTSRPSGRAPPRPARAASPPSERCPTPTPSATTRPSRASSSSRPRPS